MILHSISSLGSFGVLDRHHVINNERNSILCKELKSEANYSPTTIPRLKSRDVHIPHHDAFSLQPSYLFRACDMSPDRLIHHIKTAPNKTPKPTFDSVPTHPN